MASYLTCKTRCGAPRAALSDTLVLGRNARGGLALEPIGGLPYTCDRGNRMTQRATTYDPRQRRDEKEASRREDAKALSSGKKTRDELRAENGAFSFPTVRIRPGAAKSLT